MEGLTSITVSGTYESFVVCQPPTISWFSSAQNKQEGIFIQPAAYKNQQSANRDQNDGRHSKEISVLDRCHPQRVLIDARASKRKGAHQTNGLNSRKWM